MWSRLVLLAVAIWMAGCGAESFDNEPAGETTPPDDEAAPLSGTDSGDDADDEDRARQIVVSHADYDLRCGDDEEICRFCGPPEDVVSDCSDGGDEAVCDVLDRINEIRRDHELDELAYNETLAESAMVHAMDLSLCDYFAHDSLDGTTYFERCEATDYDGVCTGENIGGGQSSPQDVVDAWMDSPSHRDNILYEHHAEVGISYFEGPGLYGRYWVKHFGRP